MSRSSIVPLKFYSQFSGVLALLLCVYIYNVYVCKLFADQDNIEDALVEANEYISSNGSTAADDETLSTVSEIETEESRLRKPPTRFSPNQPSNSVVQQ